MRGLLSGVSSILGGMAEQAILLVMVLAGLWTYFQWGSILVAVGVFLALCLAYWGVRSFLGKRGAKREH